jgi:hypothetical protein
VAEVYDGFISYSHAAFLPLRGRWLVAGGGQTEGVSREGAAQPGLVVGSDG